MSNHTISIFFIDIASIFVLQTRYKWEFVDRTYIMLSYLHFSYRKQSGDNLLRSLSQLVTQLEADYNVLIDNEQKLEQLVTTFLKCVQQSTTAAKQKLKALKEIYSTFKKE